MIAECKEVVSIAQGERVTLTILIENKDTSEDKDLSGVTRVQSIHPKSKSAGGGFLIKQFEPGVSEISTVKALADISSSLNSTFFLYNIPGTSFYTWFNVGGAGVDPNISGFTSIEVAIAVDASASVVAGAIQVAMDAIGGITAVLSSETVTLSNDAVGSVVDIIDGGVGTGFTFKVTQQGADTAIDSVSIVGGTSKIQVILTKSDTLLLDPQQRETIHIAIDFPLPIGRKIIKIKDAYSISESGFTLT